jgi:hypothetical protein
MNRNILRLGIGLALGGSLLWAQFALGEELPPRPCQTNADCQPLDYCQKRGGDCDGRGECRDWCIHVEAVLANYDTNCGCDGRTYTDSLTARYLGVNIAHEGACR